MSTARTLARKGLSLSFDKSPFVCPTCAFSTASAISLQLLLLPTTRKASPRVHNKAYSRRVSSLASSTAINASKDIPPQFKSLHDSLSRLRKDAASFVNISRLQLAIRSLESRRPILRLAILGLPNQRTARRIARLLLADPLGEEEGWEQKLEQFKGEDDGRGLLLRYGDDADTSPSKPSEAAMYISSRVLQRHNLEVLVSSFNLAGETSSDGANAAEFRRAALIPTAESPASFSGNFSFLTYPVHRALIVAEGLKGCFTLGKYITGDDNSSGNRDVTLKLASNFPRLAGGPDGASSQSIEVSIIDAKKAAEAMDTLRESISNSSKYEQLWNASGLPELEKWLSSGFAQEATVELEPSLRAMVDDILEEASRTVLVEEDMAQALASTQPAVTDVVRQSFDQELNAWAMRGHMELRDKLDAAFTGDKWAKLGWWKLLWRTDDVSMITNELLESNWLVDAEKSIIWLSGRSVQAGIPANPQTSTLQLPEELKPDESKTKPKAPNPRKSLPSPWPTQIPATRHVLETTTIPPIQSLSQALLLQTMSVSTLTSVLSVLIYVSFPSVSIYSAAAVGTLGIAWSLRRLQKIWERAREDWEREVRERGRVVLKNVEEQFRAIVLEQKQFPVEEASGEDQLGSVDAGARDRMAARQAIEGVRSALNQIDSNNASQR